MSDAKPLDADGPAAILEPPIIASLGGDAKLSAGGYAWAIHQGGRDPFIILVTIYIFMPYVASVLVGDPVRGQATISSWDQIIGWVVVFTAPFLGASIDKLGPRKPWLGAIVGLMVPTIAAGPSASRGFTSLTPIPLSPPHVAGGLRARLRDPTRLSSRFSRHAKDRDP